MKRITPNAGQISRSTEAFRDNLGKGNYIFVGSSTDLFAENVPSK